VNVSAVDTRFNNFFIVYCPQVDIESCNNTTVDKPPENGLNTKVEITDLVAATFYNVSVYTVLSNGLSSTPLNITGRTGMLFVLIVLFLGVCIA